jgi:23S rRNA pseudouridine2457 synthase
VPLILFNKPFRVLSQFRDSGARQTLAEFISDRSAYPAGRLDYDSEGLLLLTDDGRLQARISRPDSEISKTYWVQVEGHAEPDQLAMLERGVSLRDGLAAARSAIRMQAPAALWPRIPPIRFRVSVPDEWLQIVITEGRNRQVRRMTAAAGLPTLRLIRYQIGPWSIDGLSPGQSRTISDRDAWRMLAEWRHQKRW